jgi:hypothetical protein
MINARAVHTAVPLATLAVGAAVTAWRSDIRRLEGFLIGSAVVVLAGWAAERVWEGVSYQ